MPAPLLTLKRALMRHTGGDKVLARLREAPRVDRVETTLQLREGPRTDAQRYDRLHEAGVSHV